jgi:hypothetical protein
MATTCEAREALDRLPSQREIPDVQEADPDEELGNFIRFKVQLCINPPDEPEISSGIFSDQPPAIFIDFPRDELQETSSAPGVLERAFWEKITRPSYQGRNGHVFRTIEGPWIALTTDGRTWQNDGTQGHWTEGDISYR